MTDLSARPPSAVDIDFAAVVQRLHDIRTNFKDIEESQLIFELINGQQTAIGVVQSISQHVPSFDHLEKLQSMIINLAIEVPFTQPSLVSLLEAFYSCSNKEIHNGIWGTFGMNEGDLHSSLMHDETSAEAYLNINGFEARLWQAMGEEVEDFVYGSLIGNLARSIDREEPDDHFHHTPDVGIAAACLWMIHGGERAWRLSTGDYHDEEAKDWRGDLWRGRRGYSVERWRLWKRRFEDAVEGRVGRVGRETKRLAGAAVANMEAVEGRVEGVGRETKRLAGAAVANMEAVEILGP
ncbi:hypothetical protein EJ03DRAFT_214274 [Teratosphaeria nubilosa]|uniref:Uncharacterized protein n=1 Tax=Teratosphaeria nubilosa TaxID=161662 RepID=A0A6G1LHV2_9PEZI|nr:hypothetical protein EJ03DRAFT_214274 [Teratosphaeria nubilosa]